MAKAHKPTTENRAAPRHRGLVPALAAALALGLAAPMAQADEPLVKLTQVNSGAAQVQRVFFGKAVARKTVDLAFQVSGQIVDLDLTEGAQLANGSVVAQMDLEPFELALEQAQVNAAQALRLVQRYEQLAGSSVAETNLEDARTALQLADVAVRSAKRDLEHATLHAPFDAIVATRLVPNFSTVMAGTPVVRLHDMSELRIEIDVPETVFQRAGRDPDVTLEAKFPASDQLYPLVIREFNAETADIGQTYSITLGMPLPKEFVVLPGSSAQVTATLKTDGHSIEVPKSAIVIGNDNQPHVMVFDPPGAAQGTVTRRPVEITPTDRGTVQIVSGLSDGEEIVVSGAGQLDDGAAVRRFAGFGN